MKITPTAQAGVPSINPNEGKSISPDKAARAKAAFAGVTLKESEPTGDPQAQRASQSIKKIKMKTMASVYRDIPDAAIAPVASEATPAPKEGEEGYTPDTVEPTQTTEDSKPLSPQFAALAKQKRALQVKEREIAAREAALATKGTDTSSDLVERIKSDPLGVLQENGVTYDQLTEAILANDSQKSPHISRLEAEVKALKESLENQNKSLTAKEQQNEQQVLAEMREQADQLIAAGDDYEMIRETGSQQDVVDLIKRVWDEDKKLLSVQEALDLVETDLIEESLKIARIKKVQNRLAPEPTQQAPQNPASGQRQLKTLTARDGSSVPLSAKERALLAFKGQLPR